MALSNIVCLTYTENCELFKYSNETVYGSPNQDRNQAAEVLIAAHVNVDATEDFITIDSTPYLTKILYDINNTIDGHYRFERMRFQFWSGVTAYLAKVVDGNGVITTYPGLVYYQTTGKFYKAIQDNTNIAPDSGSGAANWQEITDFTIEEIRKNTNIEVFVDNKLYDCRGRKCTKNELLKLTKNGCSCMDDCNKILPYLKRKIYLAGARSKADDLNLEEAEVITRTLENLCGKC